MGTLPVRGRGGAAGKTAENGVSQGMGSIGRYIFRTTLGAFLVVLVSLTGVIWITQALRDIDLMTNQGQTVLVFIAITSLIIPLLVLVIAPLALVIAVSHVLNKLSTDSELIVMNAAGMSPWLLFRSFLAVVGVVSLLILFVSAYLAPKGMQVLHQWVADVRTDLVTNIAQPGRFWTFERGLTFHIRERRNDGLLLGIFVDDQRDPNERITILAERGTILKDERGSFLLLETGSVQHHRRNERDPAIVLFGRYAFDLSRLSGNQQSNKISVREQFLWDLIAPAPDDPLLAAPPAQVRAELHDRLTAPIYPLAFVILAYAYLGAPRTTRQSRGVSLASAIAAVCTLRLMGFAFSVLSLRSGAAIALQYLMLALVIGGGLFAIARGVVIEPPAFLTNFISSISARLARRAMAS